MFGVVSGMADQQAIASSCPPGILRQRRTLIGQQVFVADQRERPGVTALAQGLDGLRGSLSRADDEDRSEHRWFAPL